MHYTTLSCITLLLFLPHSSALRGASPAQASFLSNGLSCIQRDSPSSPASTLSASRVNDNYCDCIDGSDEPGTSACPNGTFHCENKPSRSQILPSSRVDDGYCDCCDGSDEPVGFCENTCKDFARREEAVAREAAAAIMKGVATREKYAVDARRSIKEDARELARLKREIEGIEKSLLETKRRVASLDKWKAHEASMKKVVEGSVKEDESSQHSEHARFDELNDSDDIDNIDDLDFDEDDDLYDDSGIDEDDEEGEAAGFEADDEKDMQSDDIDRQDEIPDSIESNSQSKESPETEPAPSISVAKREEESDASGDEPKDESADSSTHEEESIDVDAVCAEVISRSPNALKQQMLYMSALIVSRLRRLFPQVPFWTGTSSKDVGDCIQHADRSKRELETTKRDIESKIKKLEDQQGINYGSDNALRKLHGGCVKTKLTQYEFEICAFDIVKQYEHGSPIATLGRFSGWEGDGSHAKMIYSNGDQCWNGPSRSIKVDLTCGDAEEIISVDEPNRCTYTMKFSTPAVCEPAAAEALLASFKSDGSTDEL